MTTTEDASIMLKFTAIALIFSAIYISFRPPLIEWDKQDSQFHGEKVKFNNTISYVKLTKDLLDKNIGFLAEEMEIGNLLVVRDSHMFHAVSKISSEIEYTFLDKEEEFTIERSYWRKSNWIMRTFHGYMHYAVLVDSNGQYSILSFFDFKYSTEPQFSELSFILK